MTRDGVETLSISLEIVAFFFAAPEFVGEHALRELGNMLRDSLRAVSRWMGWFAGLLRDEVDISFRVGRGLFVVIVAMLDAALLFQPKWEWLKLAKRAMFSFENTIVYNPLLGGFIIAVFNVIAFVYVIQIIADGGRAVVVYRRARGFLFVLGAMMFVAAKLLLIYAIWNMPRGG
jgi:hypothetical protein